MRGWFEISSKKDPRFCHSAQDFVCPHRGPLNKRPYEWIWKQADRLGVPVPDDIRLVVFWAGEEKLCETETT